MIAKREAIFAAIEARLIALDSVAEVQRMASGDPSRFPALFIEDGGQRATDGEPQATRYTIDLSIEGYVEGAGGSDTHAALNALYAVTSRAIMDDTPVDALSAATVVEIAMRVQVAQLGAVRRMGFQIDYKIEFSAARNDPAA
jgi:hypothetical protein